MRILPAVIFALCIYLGQGVCVYAHPLVMPVYAISAQQAARLAQKQVPGKVLSVSKIERAGRVIYRVKILTKDGRVRVVMIDGGRKKGR